MKMQCDVCKKDIEELEHGMLVWQKTKDGVNREFRITHQQQCDIDTSLNASMHLEEMTGSNGLARLLQMVEHEVDTHSNPARIKALLHIIRRLHLPQFEEARQYFDHPEVEEYLPEINSKRFLQQYLAEIIAIGEQPNG